MKPQPVRRKVGLLLSLQLLPSPTVYTEIVTNDAKCSKTIIPTPHVVLTLSVANDVRKAIASSPVLDEAIRLGIVNFSALARHLRNGLNLGPNSPSDAALKAALLRLRSPPNRNAFKRGLQEERHIDEVLARTQLQLRENILAVVFPPADDVLNGLRKLLDHTDRGDTLHIVVGYSNILVVIDSRNASKLFAMIPRRRSKETYENLASVVLTTPREAMDLPGISYIVYRALFLAKINILFESSVHNDTVIIVKRSDAMLAYQAIHELLSHTTDSRQTVIPPVKVDS